MAYTDLVCIGDRLVAEYTDPVTGFGKVISGFYVVSTDFAVCKQTGKRFKLNRRGNDGRLFIGNAKVLGRV